MLVQMPKCTSLWTGKLWRTKHFWLRANSNRSPLTSSTSMARKIWVRWAHWISDMTTQARHLAGFSTRFVQTWEEEESKGVRSYPDSTDVALYDYGCNQNRTVKFNRAGYSNRHLSDVAQFLDQYWYSLVFHNLGRGRLSYDRHYPNISLQQMARWWRGW